MMKLASALLGASLLLSPAWAQSPQELPSAPSPVQPRFPGAPPKQEAPAASPQSSAPPSSAQPASAQPALTTLPPSAKPAAQPEADPSTLLPPMPAQQQQPPPQQKTPEKLPSANGEADETGLFKIGVQVDLVDLIFTATDKHGKFIKDLKQSDVKLLDEGKPPEHIQAFESETGLPLRVGLLIDASNSVRDRFRFEQDAAVEFLHQVVRHNSDRAFVVGFDSLSDLTQDYTDDTEALARGVRVLRPGGGTALHDAVFQAAAKLASAPVRGAARRVIIMLSDGDDNQSRKTREEAIEAALRAEVIIYIISTNITDSNGKGDKVLMRYAEATGGKVFFPLRLQEVADDFAEIQDELRSQYVIAYKPQNFASDGRYRSVTITAPNRGNVKLRARKGYYAPKAK